jgi:hypothetical protein
MRERDGDQTLERVFRQAFSLSPEQEDILWRRFAARTHQDEHVWDSFREVMLQTAVRLRQAMEWSAWLARGLPGAG